VAKSLLLSSVCVFLYYRTNFRKKPAVSICVVEDGAKFFSSQAVQCRDSEDHSIDLHFHEILRHFTSMVFCCR
jgi:hypothetical protein